MKTRLQNPRTATIFSAFSLLLFLERVFLDFRYVALEMEAVDALFPFTAPYMLVAFFLIGLWLWGLLASVQYKRGAFITLLIFNLIALIFGVSTLLILCPTPCQTGGPVSDIIDWAMTLIAAIGSISTVLTFQSQMVHQSSIVAEG